MKLDDEFLSISGIYQALPLILLLMPVWSMLKALNSRLSGRGKRLDPAIYRKQARLVFEFVLMTMGSVLAGATAGAGASLLIDDNEGKQRVGINVGVVGIFLIEVIGIGVAKYLSRPDYVMVRDAEMLARIAAEVARTPTAERIRSVRRSRQVVKRRLPAARVNGPRGDYLAPVIGVTAEEWSWIPRSRSHAPPAHRAVTWRKRAYRRKVYQQATIPVVYTWLRRCFRLAKHPKTINRNDPTAVLAVGILAGTLFMQGGSIFQAATYEWSNTEPNSSALNAAPVFANVAISAVLLWLVYLCVREIVILENREAARDQAFIKRTQELIDEAVDTLRERADKELRTVDHGIARSSRAPSLTFSLNNWEISLHRSATPRSGADADSAKRLRDTFRHVWH